MESILRTTLVLAVLLVTGTAVADGHTREHGAADDTEQGREMIREGRLEVIRSELHLTEAEAASFWPVYEEYRAETDAIQDRYAAMINVYLRRYDEADLTNEYADELITTFIGIKRELLDVQEKYLPAFREALPSLKIARLLQLENKINAEIDAQLALVVPLIDAS